MTATDPSVASMLPLAKIQPGSNPRRYFDGRKHDDLVASLGRRGMLQPIVLRPVVGADDLFEIVAGERRYKAALEAFGPDGSVPVAIRAMTDQEALEAAIDENDVRDDTSETEQASAAAWHLAACGGDRAETARRLGWSPAKLNRRLALANLSDAVKLALDERRIKVGHAELLAAVPPDKQDKAVETILGAGLDVARTRELLMRMTQSLAAAVFDKTECATCQFNSASQCALFDTHVDDGHCTNPGCYQLRTETAEAARAAAPAPVASLPPPQAAPPAAASNPAPASATPAGRGQRPAPSPAPAPAAKPEPVLSTATILQRVKDLRDDAWRAALDQAFEGDPSFEDAFNAILRATWRVDQAFLARFGKPELKFIAQECGLVAHMGEKGFAKLLDGKVDKLIAGMLAAPGFDWAGRLPSAMTVDGQYGPPAATPPADQPKEPAAC